MSKFWHCWIPLKAANSYVLEHHRHSKPTVGHMFAIQAYQGSDVVGVAIVGRPVARGLQDGFTAEVLRVCTLGVKNACSYLYSACWRICQAMGFRRLITYTKEDESGASLRGAGWKCVGKVSARSWSCPSRPRHDKHELTKRLRWESK